MTTDDELFKQVEDTKLLWGLLALQFKLNFSEQSLMAIDALIFFNMARSKGGHSVPAGMAEVMQGKLSPSQLEELKFWVSPDDDYVGTRSLCVTSYTAEVARRNLGGTWTIQRRLLRASRIGLEFKARNKVVFRESVVGSHQYLDLKSELTDILRDLVTLSSALPTAD